MRPINKILILLLMLTSFLSCQSQSRIDHILSKKADSLNANDIGALIKSGYLPNLDNTVIGTYLVDISTKNNTENH